MPTSESEGHQNVLFWLQGEVQLRVEHYPSWRLHKNLSSIGCLRLRITGSNVGELKYIMAFLFVLCISKYRYGLNDLIICSDLAVSEGNSFQMSAQKGWFT